MSSDYQGITGIAHGGYLAGLFAQRSGRPVRVTLRRPPPLEVELSVEGDLLVSPDGETVMELAPAEGLGDHLPTVSIQEARSRPHHPRFESHPYPECFMCGTARPEGFRLHLAAPGDDSVSVGTWTPTGPLLNPGAEVSSEFVWAVVDCLTVWSFADRWEDPHWWPAVTGQIQVDQLQKIRRDAPYVLAGKTVGREGRKITVDAAIRDAAGDLCAVGRGLWIALPDKP